MKFNKGKYSVLHLGKEQPHAPVPTGIHPKKVLLTKISKAFQMMLA